MKLNVKLDINNNQIIATDISTTYLKEDDTTYPLNQFRKSDTQSILVVSTNKLEKEEAIYSSLGDTINISIDGWLSIYYLVLPTKEWFIRASKIPNILNLYDIVYYVSKGTVYWYQPNIGEFGKLSKLQELVDIAQIPNIKTTLSITKKDKVSICNLQKCYINLCQQIFESRKLTQCYNKNNIDRELIYKRDLVWMAINVIKYMVECNQLYEAEHIIELLHSCNGVCGDKKVRSNGNGCGCS